MEKHSLRYPSPESQYLDGKAKASVSSDSKPILTDDGWVVSNQPATEPERCAGLSQMQWAILVALQSGQPLPEEIRRDLAYAFEDLCAGVASDLLTPVRQAGRPHRPIKRHLQEAAIRYLRWVEDGRIADHQAIKTVASRYSVTEQTVRKWRDSWAKKPTPALFEEFGADTVKNLMEIAGTRYSQWG